MGQSALNCHNRWTERQIRDRLGVSTVALPQETRFGAAQIARIRQAEIGRIEICGHSHREHYDIYDRAQLDEIGRCCREQGIKIVSVHGPAVPYTSEFQELREAALTVGVAAARAADTLGANIFVGHFGISELSAQVIGQMLDQLPGTAIKLVVENGKGDLRAYMNFVDGIGSDRVGMIVDIGHTRDPDGVNPFTKKGRAREVLAQCGKRVFHMHLHDTTTRDHYPPFDGDIQWDEVFAALADIEYSGEFMFEALFPNTDEILDKVARFPATFAQRCCSNNASPSDSQPSA